MPKARDTKAGKGRRGVFLNAEAAVAEALRRRAETAPGEAVIAPDGQPIPEATPAKQLHGIRRRGSPLALPDERGGPISRESAPQAETRKPPGRAAFDTS